MFLSKQKLSLLFFLSFFTQIRSDYIFISTEFEKAYKDALTENNLAEAQSIIESDRCLSALMLGDFTNAQNIINTAKTQNKPISSFVFPDATSNALQKNDFTLAEKIIQLAKAENSPISDFTFEYACQKTLEKNDFTLAEKIIQFAKTKNLIVNSCVFTPILTNALTKNDFILVEKIIHVAKTANTTLKCDAFDDACSDALRENNFILAEKIIQITKTANTNVDSYAFTPALTNALEKNDFISAEKIIQLAKTASTTVSPCAFNDACCNALNENNFILVEKIIQLAKTINITIDSHTFTPACCNALRKNDFILVEKIIHFAKTQNTSVDSYAFTPALTNALTKNDSILVEKIIHITKTAGATISPGVFNDACCNALKESNFILAEKIIQIAKTANTTLSSDAFNDACCNALKESNFILAEKIIQTAKTANTTLSSDAFNDACCNALKESNFILAEKIIQIAKTASTNIDSYAFNNACSNALKKNNFILAEKIIHIAKTTNTNVDSYAFTPALTNALEKNDFILAEKIIQIAKTANTTLSSDAFDDACCNVLKESNFILAEKIIHIAKTTNTRMSSRAFDNACSKALKESNITLAENILQLAQTTNRTIVSSVLNQLCCDVINNSDLNSLRLEQILHLTEKTETLLSSQWFYEFLKFTKNIPLGNQLIETTIRIINKKINAVEKLNYEQKTLLLDFYKNLDFKKLIFNNNQSYEDELSIHYKNQLSMHPAANLPVQILCQYCPLLCINKLQSGHLTEKEESLLHMIAYKIYTSVLEPFNESAIYSSPFLKNSKQNKPLIIPNNHDTQSFCDAIFDNFINNPDLQPYLASYILLPRIDQELFLKSNKFSLSENFYKGGFTVVLAQSGILSKVKECEKRAKKEKQEVFYHGRRWSWNFVNDMFNLIQALQQNQKTVSNKISLRYRQKNCDTQQLLQYRTTLLANGLTNHLGTGTNKSGCDAEITCINKSPFSNSEYYGECTGIYFVENHSIANTGAEWEFVKKLFQDQNLSDYFNNHEEDIKKLFELHKQASIFGELLAIKIDSKEVDNLIYPAVSGGLKAKTHIKPSEIIQGIKQKAKKNLNFIDARREFFCLAVSDIPGEYDKKYTIESLNLADPKKYQEYLQGRNKLFEDIQKQNATFNPESPSLLTQK